MPVYALPDIPPTDETFLAQWARRACALESAGAYAWMASQIFGTHRVLEVGCGSQESTLALLQAGKQVIAVEANEAALDACMRRLAHTGAAVLRATSLAEAASAKCDAVVVRGDFLDLAPVATTGFGLTPLCAGTWARRRSAWPPIAA
jgi:SAM-dependent methyltransferase